MTTVTDWPKLPIGAIALPKLGGNYRNNSAPTRRPLIKMGNIARISMNLSRLEFIPDSETVENAHRLRFGDVLLNTRNTLDLVGKVSIWRDELPIAYYNSNILRLEFQKKYCGDSQYFGYALNAADAINDIRALATGTTSVAAVYTRDLLKLKIPVPSKEEQRAIVAALIDADRLTGALERLITKQQAIKQGMMQQLLTGRTRLPGFTCPWTTTTWGDVAPTISSGATPRRSRSDYWGGSIRWVTSTELDRGTIREVPQTITALGVSATNLTVWPPGTFLMAITGLEAAGTRGNCGILEISAASNQSCMAVIPNHQLDARFLFYYYLLRGEELALRFTQGTKQQSYTAGIVRTLPISMPTSIKEQQAIVMALTDADSQIELLRARLTKARAIKAGMMQQLLTGRTRLPMDAAS